jgi:hypothetical protein
MLTPCWFLALLAFNHDIRIDELLLDHTVLKPTRQFELLGFWTSSIISPSLECWTMAEVKISVILGVINQQKNPSESTALLTVTAVENLKSNMSHTGSTCQLSPVTVTV